MKRADRIKLMQQALEREQAMDPEEDVTETEIKLEIKGDPKPDDGGNPGPAEGATTEDPPAEDPPTEDPPKEDPEVEVKVDDIVDVEDYFDPETFEVRDDKIPDKRIAYAVNKVMEVMRSRRDNEMLMNKVMEEIKSYDLSVEPEKALKLIDISKVTLDKDGNVVGLDEEIKKVQEDFPMIFKRRRTTKPTDKGMNPAGKTSTMKVKDIKF